MMVGLGCAAEQSAQDMDKGNFFDLADYIDEYLNKNAATADVTKVIEIDGQQESKKLEDYNLAADLQIFRDLNINKPALWDKYRVTEEGGDLHYLALEDGLRIRTMKVSKQNQRISQIEIVEELSTFLTDIRSTYKFLPASGYEILKEENPRFGNPIKHKIKVATS